MRLEADRRFLGRREEKERVGGSGELLDERAAIGAGRDVDERASALFPGRDP
jgi:hypothetical protein